MKCFVGTVGTRTGGVRSYWMEYHGRLLLDRKSWNLYVATNFKTPLRKDASYYANFLVKAMQLQAVGGGLVRVVLDQVIVIRGMVNDISKAQNLGIDNVLWMTNRFPVRIVEPRCIMAGQ